VTSIEYTHEYPYRTIHWLGPYIPIRLFALDGTPRDILGLLDSGAWQCTFHANVAESLGIDWRTGNQQTINGVTKVTGFEHRLKLQVGPMPEPLECKVLFVDTLPKGINLIGRQGIFESLIVGFNEKRKKIYLALQS
jgi:hypothetical protein